MSPGVPTRVIAASCGLAGFAVAIVAGLAADNPAEDILVHALIALFACNVVGWIAGIIAEKTIREGAATLLASRDVNNISTVDESSTSDSGVVRAVV